MASKISLCSRLLEKCGKNAIRRAEKAVEECDAGLERRQWFCKGVSIVRVEHSLCEGLDSLPAYPFPEVQLINVTCFSKFRMKVESSDEILHTPNAS